MELTTDIFSLFDKKWALLTAGDRASFNSMTVSWGGLGTLWGKSVATVYVRTSRFTHEFMDREGFFTLSFFPESCRDKLLLLGTKSGRDMDKMNGSGLEPLECAHGVTYREAELTLVCRKLFMERLDPAKLDGELREKLYAHDAPRDMYIGEVTELIRR